MTRRQYYGALIVLVVSGLAGGALSTWLLPGQRAWAQEEGPAREVRAQRFVLVDEVGREGATLELLDRDEPALRLFDENGRPRMVLRLHYGEPWLTFLDGNEHVRISCGLAFDGPPADPEFYFGDIAGSRLVLMTSDGHTELRLFDETGFRGSLSITEDPRLVLVDQMYRVRWQAP